MRERRYGVPAGMHAVAMKHHDSEILCEAVLLKVIQWIAENPIVPSPQQVEQLSAEYAATSHALPDSPHRIAWMMTEWPRRMFLLPETPEERMEREVAELARRYGVQDTHHYVLMARDAYLLGVAAAAEKKL